MSASYRSMMRRLCASSTVKHANLATVGGIAMFHEAAERVSLQQRPLLVPQVLVPVTSMMNPISKRSLVMITQTKSGELDSIPKATTSDTVHDVSLSDDRIVTQQQHQLFVTDSCWNRIYHLASKKNQSLSDLYLRVYVDAGGCSGFSYKFELDTADIDVDDDIVFADGTGNGAARVVVDSGSYEYIKGSKIDYVQEMIKSNFEVKDNPQSESACGCGSSFAVKNFGKNPALD